MATVQLDIIVVSIEKKSIHQTRLMDLIKTKVIILQNNQELKTIGKLFKKTEIKTKKIGQKN